MMDEKTKMLYAALAILGVCLLYFFLITFAPVPKSGEKYADIILGVLAGSGFTQLLNFYWGSSHKKDPPQPEEEKPV